MKNETLELYVDYLISSFNATTATDLSRVAETMQEIWLEGVDFPLILTNLAKSPTKTRTTQTYHFFASLYGYIKVEQLKINTKLNHFALKNKLYIKAVQQAFQTLQKMLNSDVCVR